MASARKPEVAKIQGLKFRMLKVYVVILADFKGISSSL
jgi:hypothetical protein